MPLNETLAPAAGLAGQGRVGRTKVRNRKIRHLVLLKACELSERVKSQSPESDILRSRGRRRKQEQSQEGGHQSAERS